jgi:hypothetical protein
MDEKFEYAREAFEKLSKIYLDPNITMIVENSNTGDVYNIDDVEFFQHKECGGVLKIVIYERLDDDEEEMDFLFGECRTE